MVKYSIKAEPFLGKFSQSFDGTKLTEIDDIEILSLACPAGGLDNLNDRLIASFKFSLPQTGSTIGAIYEKVLIIGMSPGQWFLVANSVNHSALKAIRNTIGDKGYFTDQSDNWVALLLEGKNALLSLERICPIDLHLSVFPEGSFARTKMEHINVLIYRENSNRLLLFAPSSYALSFLHEVKTSLLYVSS